MLPVVSSYSRDFDFKANILIGDLEAGCGGLTRSTFFETVSLNSSIQEEALIDRVLFVEY